MARVEAPLPESLPREQREMLARTEALMGFTPNDARTMALVPDIMRSVLGLAEAVYAPGTIGSDLKRLIGLVTSAAAGCRYCTAHTAFACEQHQISESRLAGVWTFETHPEYTDAERAALRVAWHAGQVPNAVSDEQFEALAGYYDTVQQLEIVAVISMLGFLNRWNATLAVDLEALPGAALDRIAPEGSNVDSPADTAAFEFVQGPRDPGTSRQTRGGDHE